MKHKTAMIANSWAAVWPDGTVLVDNRFLNEADTWKIALGWPTEQEIEEAKKRGMRVCKVTVVVPVEGKS